MEVLCMCRYVLTGGPCAGKTTTLKVLALRGYGILTETAREIIEKEVAKGSDVLPWKNQKKFQEAVAWKQLWKEFFVDNDIPIFLDRGLNDGYGYSVLEKVTVPKIITWFGKNRYDKIFLLDPLPFYELDNSRTENQSFAYAVHEEIRKAYIRFGYDIIIVPVLPTEERANFIIERLKY